MRQGAEGKEEDDNDHKTRENSGQIGADPVFSCFRRTTHPPPMVRMPPPPAPPALCALLPPFPCSLAILLIAHALRCRNAGQPHGSDLIAFVVALSCAGGPSCEDGACDQGVGPHWQYR